jgi:hypothetical protein
MTYTKLVNGEPIPMTAQEIAERQAEEAAWEAGRADREWQEKIKKTDAKIPRYVEDIIDALDGPTKGKIAQATLDAYNEKKLIRAEKNN